MPSLADVPLEVLIDNLLPLLPLNDLYSLTLTSKALSALCSDDTFWKRKLEQDYNFSDANSARTKGYKFLYKGVHNAKVYVWGSSGEGRLGFGVPHIQHGGILAGSVPYPMKLDIPGPRIVDLAAGGWSFHALDSEGGVHVWGQLDGGPLGGLHQDPFSYSTKRTQSPVKLILSEKITKIGCGRAHATALSSSNRVWVFSSWGRPYVLNTHLLSTSSTFSTPRQVECGWAFSAVLTHGGQIYVWWPLDGEFGRLDVLHNDQMNEAGDRVENTDDVVHCRPWEVDTNPNEIRPINFALPNLRGEEHDVGDKIIKIAAGDKFLVALTEGGHVLKVDLHNGPTDFDNSLRRPRWDYLPRFSEIEHIRAHATFNPQGGSSGKSDVPETLQITHISAHFLTFFAYSTGTSSVVLRGSKDTLPDTQPDIPPSLQNRGVISVVLGDYHFGALTSTGKLLTWGAYSSGALGLGDPTQLAVGSPGGYVSERERERAKRFRHVPPDVVEPTEVKFGTRTGGEGRESFVFGATASGWHCGALVIDLEDGEEENAEEADSETPHRDDDLSTPSSLPGQPWAGHLPFRIGLAGARVRGRGRGGVPDA